MRKLAIITTHPIQYYAPVFQGIAKHHPQTKVFYTWGEGSINKYDPDFKKKIEWDIPLLDGYEYEFLKNTSGMPGTASFRGIINPDALKAIDAFDPDVILVYGWSWQSHLKIIRHYSKKKTIWFRGDSTLLDTPKGIKAFIRYLVLRWIYRHIDLAFYVGTHNKAYFSHFGLKESQLRFAPHSVDNDRFSISRKEESDNIWHRFGIPPTGKLILFAGKFEPKKDPFTLLEAFETIQDDNVFLLFAGNGVLEEELKSRAGSSVKKKNIFFIGFQNQSTMPALYQACQVFCLPSAGPGETWGLAVNEAMAAGKAVIVSDKVGCAVDLVKENVNGSVFRSGDVNDLADKLNHLLNEPDPDKKFGSASRQIIENWSFQTQVSIFLEELNSHSCRN